MERLSIDEVIEHCNKTCDTTEKIAKARGCELESIESKQFWEHYQVREWLKELKKYKDAEEQGLLLKLPCKVGDEFWVIAYKSKVITHVKCSGYAIQEDIPNGIKNKYVWLDSVENPRDYWKLDFEDFKKQCFKTEEEAEQALKQMGEREDEDRKAKYDSRGC